VHGCEDKTQFPQEDPYQPRGGRREELRLIAEGHLPAMPPPPDRIHYASPASQVPASSHVPTVLQDNQATQQGNTAQQASMPSTETQPQRAQRGGTHSVWGRLEGETPKDTPPNTGGQAPKAPPPKPPSSSEDEWPSEGEAPPEEDDTTMVQLGSRSRSPDRGAGPAGEPTNPASSSSTGRSSRTYRHHLEIDDGFEKKNSLQEVSYQAQMAATLVEIVRHILRDTLHATSVRTELAEVGELLEDVVADFGASIRLRDSAGIAEGRDALMEAVDILDDIVLNYDSEHDEFTMDPATLQDDLLRLAQPASNSQELFEGYGDEMGLMQLHRPGGDPSGDTEESHRCAIQLLSVLEREFPESYRTNGQCEADAIWLLLRGERLAEYIDGMNIPAEERVRGGEDEHPGLAGTYQNHEGNARDNYRGRQPRQRGGAEDHPDDFEPMALIQSQLRGGPTGRGKPLPTPNAFEIAALTAGIMEESSQQGEPPSMAELLEVLELVQAGMALLTRGRHSYNWQVTHWATDAAEEALALLSVATATDDPSELGRTPPQLGDLLPRLRNLLDEAATGIGVLVGIYPHWG
ncbi:unnamed protein product, partial [Symbiodinium sp. KB8]